MHLTQSALTLKHKPYTLTLNPNFDESCFGKSGRHQPLTLISANRVSANWEDTGIKAKYCKNPRKKMPQTNQKISLSRRQIHEAETAKTSEEFPYKSTENPTKRPKGCWLMYKPEETTDD